MIMPQTKIGRIGLWMVIIGLAAQFINIITYGLWGIDIDILGMLVLVIGVVLCIIGWKKGKQPA